MAYKRRYYAGRKTYYKRARYSRSSRAISTSRAFRASAANMTQNGKFNISKKFWQTINILINDADAKAILDLPNEIITSEMHAALSNVFDQYRIEKMTLKFNLLINQPVPDPDENTHNVSHVAFFTCVDRSGFATNPSVSSLRTYGSYKETTWSTDGDTNTPHIITIGQADLVSKSEYYDTKQKCAFPQVCVGFDLGQVVTAQIPLTFTCEIDAQIRYRGVRLDTTGVSF